MRSRARILWVLLVVGCNEVINPGVPAYVTVLETPGEGDFNLPLGGVEVCETDTGNCAVTKMNGEATLWLPPDEEVSFTAEKEGYLSLLKADVTDVEELHPRFFMVSHEEAVPWWTALDSRYPQMGTAGVAVGLLPALAGVMFELVDATGKAFYNIEGSCGGCSPTPSRDLTETTPLGSGGFVEIPPAEGKVQIGFEVVGTDSDCVPIEAWPADETNRISVPIRAGYFTISQVRCSPP